jgi:hypothetical protein
LWPPIGLSGGTVVRSYCVGSGLWKTDLVRGFHRPLTDGLWTKPTPERNYREVSTGLAIAALTVAAVAAVFSGLSWAEVKRSAHAAEGSAGLDNPVEAPGDRAIYRVRNDGPRDLDALIVSRPRPPDDPGGIKYPFAVTGGTQGWADDEITLGPIPMGQEVRFTLCCSAAVELPEFRVRMACRAEDDIWTLNELLPSPRMPSRDSSP